MSQCKGRAKALPSGCCLVKGLNLCWCVSLCLLHIKMLMPVFVLVRKACHAQSSST